MKVFSLSPFLLALGLLAVAQAAILTEAKNPQQDRFLPLKEDVLTRINDLVSKSPFAKDIVIFKENCPEYNPKSSSPLSICVSAYNPTTNSLTLQLRSPNNHFELEFSNIDVNDPASDIKIEPYLNEYLDSLKELALTPEKRQAEIVAGIKAGAQELGIVGVEVTSDGKITYAYKGKSNSVIYKVDKDLLEFSTDFFQDTIDLNIPMTRFINFEVKKMTKEIIDHLYQMQRFALSDGESAAQSIKTLTCKSIMGDSEMSTEFIARMAKNGLVAEFAEETMTITKDAKKVAVGCAPLKVGDFGLLEVKADFAGVNSAIQPVTQTYLEKSLYNLLPVSVAFFHDLGTFVIRVLADRNMEEEFEPMEVEVQGG